MDKSFHSLIRAAFGVLQGFFGGIGMGFYCHALLLRRHDLVQFTAKFFHIAKARAQVNTCQQLFSKGSSFRSFEMHGNAHKGGKSPFVFLTVRLDNAFGHSEIKVRHTLPTVHFILVGLNGYAGKSRIAFNGVGFTQVAVPGGKSVFKQGDKIYLAARFREHIEIFVMNMDIAIDMG